MFVISYMRARGLIKHFWGNVRFFFLTCIPRIEPLLTQQLEAQWDRQYTTADVWPNVHSGIDIKMLHQSMYICTYICLLYRQYMFVTEQRCTVYPVQCTEKTINQCSDHDSSFAFQTTASTRLMWVSTKLQTPLCSLF